MLRLKTVFAGLAGLAAAIALPAAANAATVSIRDNPDNGGSVFATGLGRSISIQHDGSNRNVQAGAFSLQHDENGGWTDFVTFCLQLSEYLSLPKDHERVAGGDYFGSSDDLEALGVLYGDLMTADFALKNANTAAAAQAIVWEIVEDGATSFDLAAGDFKLFTSDVLSEAQSLWALIISGDYLASAVDVFHARGTQDLLTSAVPIPGALPLLLSGIAGLGFASRKQRSRV
ncbi:VPLPA-CTERM sorting domain-containing protein [Hyphococcus luteus]|uniref:VPLPA-CTERM sorting domain-containing protein n=1 Tax=Hyphococcus luteus TaxID=2058213 RepID=UPI00105709D9|nr:VPLPA-CTERM sorting domain-containing protein [Marinicaulis flavus]